jgi:hypothetical protein
MSKAGLDVQVITVTPKESMLSTRDKLVSSKRDRLLLIVVDEWYHDTTVGNIELNFNVVMHVLNAEGVKLGESSIKGLEIVGSNMWNPVAEAYDRLPVVFEKKFEHLFNQQEIERALE